MTGPDPSTDLSPARFAALADAYGGNVARWPEAIREPGFRLAAASEGAAILAAAAALDERLDMWRIPSPAPALAARLLAHAPRGGALRIARRWWAIGAAALLGGAAAGTVAAATIAPADHAQEAGTAFGDLPPGEG